MKYRLFYSQWTRSSRQALRKVDRVANIAAVDLPLFGGRFNIMWQEVSEYCRSQLNATQSGLSTSYIATVKQNNIIDYVAAFSLFTATV